MEKRLIEFLPRYYQNSNVMKNIMSSQDEALKILQNSIQNMMDEFFVDSADITLDKWEKDLGIPVNSSKEEAFRKSVIKSKLRGIGTITKDLLQNVCQSYDQGKIRVIENEETIKNNKFMVRFVDTLGAPPNLEDLKNAVEEIKPAHLIVEYIFKYLMVHEVEKLTIDQIQKRLLTDFSPCKPII